jgi:modulator of FtsH protease HflC
MKRSAVIASAVGAGIVLLLLWSMVFTVHQREQAMILQFGQPVAVIKDPGLHLKDFPWPFQNVVHFDKRVLNLDAPTQEVIAQDRKRLMVDAFARWRISDPLRYYQSLGSRTVADQRLGALLLSNLRRVLGAQTFAAVLSGERAKLMHDIRDGVNNDARSFGVAIVDVRIRRADLPQANSEAIYERMKQERVREATEYRSQGEQIKLEIIARADRDATIIRATATRQAEITRGEGDAEKNRIFAGAFGRDPEFFNFYRSMKAYEAAMRTGSTSAVLSPDSEFFRYFQRGAGGGR